MLKNLSEVVGLALDQKFLKLGEFDGDSLLVWVRPGKGFQQIVDFYAGVDVAHKTLGHEFVPDELRQQFADILLLLPYLLRVPFLLTCDPAV